jgi:sec-independent protein translocase protein TatC
VSQQAVETPPGDTPEEDEGGRPMTFWEHLEELRVRLIRSIAALFVGCLVAWNFHAKILELLKRPYADAWAAGNLPGLPALHQAAPVDGFMAYVKLALIGGALLAAPVVFYQLWSFIAPGLYAREKRYVIPFVTFSTALFAGGGYFAWRIAIPLSMRYFLALSHEGGDAATVAITPTFMVDKYIDFCLQVLLGFGLTFELPMIFLFLSVAGVVNYLMLIRHARWFILLAFVVAAILTPPDVISQLSMAIPMCVLYALSIGLVYIFGKPPSEAEKEAWKNRKNKPAAE